MTVREMSNYFNQAKTLEGIYKNHKSIGRLIRSNVFTYNSTRYGNVCDLKYKITYLKANKNDDLVVNIKVCGKMSRWYGRDNAVCITKYNNTFRESSRGRNNDIRRMVEKDVKNYFRLFGLDTYRLEIGKVKVCEEL